MSLPHVFATGSATVSDLGYPVTVRQGTCWLADDPLVVARPDLFADDCRYALGRDQSWSGEPPECMTVPPDVALAPGADDENDGSSAAMTRAVRSRSHAERSRVPR